MTPKQSLLIDGIKVSINQPQQQSETNQQVAPTDRGITPIQQPTELGEAMRVLDDDELDMGTRMSKIDFNTRLHEIEINYILAVDTLVMMRVCPTECLALTRQKKRLMVSLEGKGRIEKVELVAGKREQDSKTGIMGSIQNGFKGLVGAK